MAFVIPLLPMCVAVHRASSVSAESLTEVTAYASESLTGFAPTAATVRGRSLRFCRLFRRSRETCQSTCEGGGRSNSSTDFFSWSSEKSPFDSRSNELKIPRPFFAGCCECVHAHIRVLFGFHPFRYRLSYASKTLSFRQAK